MGIGGRFRRPLMSEGQSALLTKDDTLVREGTYGNDRAGRVGGLLVESGDWAGIDALSERGFRCARSLPEK